MDQGHIKAEELHAWTAVAPGWRKHDARLVAQTAAVSSRLLDLAGLREGHRVLDIACGTGEPAIPAAMRVGATGRVTATDFVEPMLDMAREKAAAQGLTHIEFLKADGEALEVPSASVDAVTIRWGIMFMPDPLRCLKRAYEALKPGGRVAIACWSAPEKNAWVTIPMGVIKRHMEVPPPPPGATGIFSFADPERIRQTLEDAGFKDLVLEEVSLSMADFDRGADFFAFTQEIAGPIAALYAKLTPEIQATVASEVAREAEDYCGAGGRVVIQGVTWVASGLKPLGALSK